MSAMGKKKSINLHNESVTQIGNADQTVIEMVIRRLTIEYFGQYYCY